MYLFMKESISQDKVVCRGSGHKSIQLVHKVNELEDLSKLRLSM